MRTLRSFLTLASLAALAAVGHADLTFAFDDATLQLAPGGMGSFSGTLTVTDDPLYVNGDSVTQFFPTGDAWVGVQFDDVFLSNLYADYPDAIPAGTVWHGTLFNVTLDPSVTPGSVSPGSVLFQGGPTAADQDPFGSDYTFQIEAVQAVPEPASFFVLALPLLALRRRKAWRD